MRCNLMLIATAGMLVLLTASCKKKDPNAAKACFTVPDEISAGVPAAFNSSCSLNAITYAWDFGDGGTSAEASPSHTYSASGEFNVSLSVVADNGSTDAVSVNISVGAPALIEHTGQVTEDETWIEGVHVLTGDVYVQGATLTIMPGAVIKFSQGHGLYFGYYSGSSGATLIANGTTDKPIVFTSSASTKSPGDWDVIGFFDGSSNLSSMDHCMVEYGGSSDNYGMIYVEGCGVSIANSTIENSENQGIVLNNEGRFVSFTDNQLDQNGSSAIQIEPDYVHTIGTGNDITSSQGIAIKSGRFEQEAATWLKQTTFYRLTGDLYVGSETGSNLTLSPGVEIRMGEGVGMNFGYYGGTFGVLTAEGTASDHITFTSAAPSGSQSPGDWDYIGFFDGAGTGSSMEYCDLKYGGSNETYGCLYIKNSGVSLVNSSISGSQTLGAVLQTEGIFTECTGNTFSDIASYPIQVYANYANTIGTGNVFSDGKGVLVKSGKIEQDEITWNNLGVPYIVSGSMYLGSESGSKLTIEPGAVLSFSNSAALYVGYYNNTYGILVADADAGSEIVFTSAAPAGFESAGDWDGIYFEDGTSNGSILDHCNVMYGGGNGGNTGDITVRNSTAGIPVISNCNISSSNAWGIYVRNGASPALTDNSYSDNATGDVYTP